MGNHAYAATTNLDRTMIAGDWTVIVPFKVIDFGFVNKSQEIEFVLFRNFHHFHRFWVGPDSETMEVMEVPEEDEFNFLRFIHKPEVYNLERDNNRSVSSNHRSV